MPDHADHSSSSMFHGAAIGRRGLLRLGITAVILASCRRLGVKESPNSAQIANLGSAIELSADAAYCNDTVLRDISEQIVMFGAMRPDAVLTTLPPKRRRQR